MLKKRKAAIKEADYLDNAEFLKLGGARCPSCFSNYTLEVVPNGDIGDLVEEDILEHELEFKCSACKREIKIRFNASMMSIEPLRQAAICDDMD